MVKQKTIDVTDHLSIIISLFTSQVSQSASISYHVLVSTVAHNIVSRALRPEMDDFERHDVCVRRCASASGGAELCVRGMYVAMA